MKNVNISISKKLLENAMQLGLIQVSEYEFQVSIKSDFKVDLSASGDSQIAILTNIAKQAVQQRDFHIDKYNSLVTTSLNGHSKTYEIFKQSQSMNENLINQNKKMIDFLIDLSKNKKSPSVEEINSLLDS